MAAEELVQGVLPGEVQRQALAAPSRPAPHLAQARHGSGEGDADRGVELADVDPELEGVGRHHGQQLSARQRGFDLAALLGGVPGAVGRDQRPELGHVPLGEAVAREALDQLYPAAAVEKADRAHSLADESREHVSALGQHRPARPRALVDQRRVPHRDPSRSARRTVGVDERKALAAQALGELERVRDRRRGENEPRLRAVQTRHATKPAQDVRDVRAEHPPVHVRLVDDDPTQVGEEVAPALVVRQDPDVEHVGIGEHEVGAPTDAGTVLARRVAVVDRVAQLGWVECRQRPSLVLSQRLGRVQVQGPPPGVAGEAV